MKEKQRLKEKSGLLTPEPERSNNTTVFRETIEKVRTGNDIVSVVGEYVKLQRSGKNHFGLCPFHKEKTASFSVSVSSQRFKCYGCGEAGDVFDFVSGIQGVPFLDALRKLGQRAGISVLVSAEQEQVAREKERAFGIMRKAGAYFYRHLFSRRGKQALKYLLDRGFEEDFLREYGFGAAPACDYKAELIQTTGATEQELLDLGLLHAYDSGVNVYFRNMVLIPFFKNGRLVMYQGRRLTNEEEYGKYKKPTVEVLSRLRAGQLLWNHDAARGRKEVHLFEGILDAATAVQVGLVNSIALPGTQFTTSQLDSLRRADKVYVWMDADRAGQEALDKLIERFGKRMRIVSLDRGKKDVNEWWCAAKGDVGQARAKDMLHQLITSATDPVQFYIGQLLGASENEWFEKIRRIAELVVSWGDPVKLEITKSEIQTVTRLGKRTVQKIFAEVSKKVAPGSYGNAVRRSESYRSERRIMIDEFQKSFYIEQYDMNGERQVVYVSNFLIDPVYTRDTDSGEKMYEMYFYNDYDSAHVVITGRQLVNARDFKAFCRERGEFLWNGSDEVLYWLNEYLIEQRVPMIKHVSYAGYHEDKKTWFFPAYAFKDGEQYKSDDNGVFWIEDKGFVMERNPAYEVFCGLVEKEPDKKSITAYMDAMQLLYGNYGWLGMGWMVSSMQAHVISRKLKQFPYLYATGLFEKGKTTFLQNLFCLAGQDVSLPTLPSKDTWRKSVSWFSSLPIGYDEANEKGRNKRGGDFFDNMREYMNQTFNRSVIERGALDPNRTIRYPVRATVAFAGEFPVSIPSVQSRTIFVNSLHFTRDEQAIQTLQECAVAAVWLGQYLIRTSNQWEAQWFENYHLLYGEYLQRWKGASRVKKNYAIALAGSVTLMQIVDDMLNEQRYFGRQVDELVALLQNESEESFTSAKQSHPCIEYLRDIAIMAMERRLLKNVHFAIEQKGESRMLYISPTLTWDAYLQKQGNREVAYSSSRKIVNDLSFFPFFHGMRKMRMAKMTVRAWEIDLNHPELPEEIRFFEYEAYD